MNKITLFVYTFFLCLFTSSAQWTQTNGPEGGNTREIIQIGTDLVVSASTGGLYRSNDNGNSWVNSNAGLPDGVHVSSLTKFEDTVYVSVASGIYRSTDGGVNWVKLNMGNLEASFYQLLVSGDNIFAGNANGGITYSNDGGGSWYYSEVNASNTQIQDFEIFNSKIYAASGVLYESSDYGMTWQEVNIAEAGVNGVRTLFAHDDILYAGGLGEVFVANSDLSSWTKSPLMTNASIVSIVGHQGRIYVNGSMGSYHYSDDNGQSWSKVQNTASNSFIADIYISENRILLSTLSGVFGSSDSGMTWSSNNNGIAALNIPALYIDNQSIYAGSANNSIFKSANNGDSWTSIGNGLDAPNASSISEIIRVESDIYIATGGGIYKSSNSGQNWVRKLDPGINKSTRSLVYEGGYLITANDESIFLSNDYGENWLEAEIDILNQRTSFTSIAAQDNIIVTSTSDGEILLSIDLGNTWSNTSIPNGFYFTYDLEFFEEKLYAATAQGVFVSENLGQSWKIFNNFYLSAQDIVITSDIIFAPTSSGLYATREDLDLWYPINGGLNGVPLNNIFLNDDTIYAGTFGYSVWKLPLSQAKAILPEPNIVTNFTLVNSETNEDILEISEGTEINLSEYPGVEFSIRANTSDAVKSVSLQLSGTLAQTMTESVAPYALYGDLPAGNYNGQLFPVGSYTIAATPYSEASAGGNDGQPLTINFKIIDTPLQRPFITTWKTDNSGISEDNQITISVDEESGFTYNYNVDWGDGQTSLNVTGEIVHSYETVGMYQVSISGEFPAIRINRYSDFSIQSDAHKLISINQWGDIEWQTMEQAFEWGYELDVLANDVPDLSRVVSLSRMFGGCIIMEGNPSIGNWNVSNIEDMSWTFASTSFNQSIMLWDVSKVSNMSGMFSSTPFNQNLSSWNVSNVGDMSFMFYSGKLTLDNYDSTLIGWSELPTLQPNVILNASPVKYCLSEEARQKLIDDFGWTITDGGKALDCNPCPTTQITLSTQQQVDNFATTYDVANCTFEGGILIEGTDITNLNGLYTLTNIQGPLTIRNTAISNLDGLFSLNNPGWVILIEGNSLMTDIDGLSSITNSSSLIISDNALLTNVDGLASLERVSSDLIIKNNGSLANLDGLSSLLTISDSFVIKSNASLNNLGGLSSLLLVDNDLVIESNPILTNIDGLSNLDIVGHSLSIQSNASLTNLDGLSSVIQMYGDLKIINNDILTNLNGLASLNSIVGELNISENDALSNCAIDAVCNSSTIVGGTVTISRNTGNCIDETVALASCIEVTEGEADLIAATFLEGSRNPLPTGPILRAEEGNREIYLKYDLSSFNGTITNAELTMQVASDPGYGDLEVFLGSDSNWTETGLNGNNKPTVVGNALASISGTHGLGQAKRWGLDISRLNGGGLVTLIVKHSNGNDVAFASDETDLAPQLIISSELDKKPTITAFEFYEPGTDVVVFEFEGGKRYSNDGLFGDLYGNGGLKNIRPKINNDVRSIEFSMSGAVELVSQDSSFPFEVYPTNINSLEAGFYTLTATPYSGENFDGIKGEVFTLTFEIFNFCQESIAASYVETFPSDSNGNGGIAILHSTWGPFPDETSEYGGIWKVDPELGWVAENLNPGTYTVQIGEFVENSCSTRLEFTINEINNKTTEVTAFWLDSFCTTEEIEITDGVRLDTYVDSYFFCNSAFQIRPTLKGEVASVYYNLSGPEKIQETYNSVPFSLFDTDDVAEERFSLQTGIYTLTATPYSQINRGGEEGKSYSVTFEVFNLCEELQENASVETTNASSCSTADGTATFSGGIGATIVWSHDANLRGLAATDLSPGTYWVSQEGPACSVFKEFTIESNEPCQEVENSVDLIDATYLQGSRNPEPTGPILRTEEGNRVTYLKFDLNDFTGDITEARLEMQVASDPGNGTLEVFLGSNSNWTETGLNGSNKPVALGNALASISGTHSLGQTKTWNLDVSQISGGGFVTLIVKHRNGNDVAFASDETNQAPELIVSGQGALAASSNSLSLSPNPASEEIAVGFEVPIVVSAIFVYDVSGKLVHSVPAGEAKSEGDYPMDVSDLPSGMYFVRTFDADGIPHQKSMVIEN